MWRKCATNSVLNFLFSKKPSFYIKQSSIVVGRLNTHLAERHFSFSLSWITSAFVLLEYLHVGRLLSNISVHVSCTTSDSALTPKRVPGFSQLWEEKKQNPCICSLFSPSPGIQTNASCHTGTVWTAWLSYWETGLQLNLQQQADVFPLGLSWCQRHCASIPSLRQKPLIPHHLSKACSRCFSAPPPCFLTLSFFSLSFQLRKYEHSRSELQSDESISGNWGQTYLHDL